MSNKPFAGLRRETGAPIRPEFEVLIGNAMGVRLDDGTEFAILASSKKTLHRVFGIVADLGEKADESRFVRVAIAHADNFRIDEEI